MSVTKQVGDTLSNGYTILIITDEFVLAEKAGHAFASWAHDTNIDNTYWGHYFDYSYKTTREDSLYSALTDFTQRIA